VSLMSHIQTYFQIWVRHVTYEWVMPYANNSWHTRKHMWRAARQTLKKKLKKNIVSLMNAFYSDLTPTELRTGWRRPTGSFKLQIILHKRATTYRLLLRNMTHKDKGSYESLPPCFHIRHIGRSNVTYEWVISTYK